MKRLLKGIALATFALAFLLAWGVIFWIGSLSLRAEAMSVSNFYHQEEH